ncbi:hypothetical protein KYY02_22145 [Streptomyces pimonensis]|uniref:Uncharacterized protein n=1 Tax=Streptomyces pimonensis TaxID=2860288 RepID=A0ABV4J2Z6_9ACTN
MSLPNGPSSPDPSTSQEVAIQQVVDHFAVYTRIRRARDGIPTAVHFTPRDEQRAFDDLQQAISRLRTLPR